MHETHERIRLTEDDACEIKMACYCHSTELSKAAVSPEFAHGADKLEASSTRAAQLADRFLHIELTQVDHVIVPEAVLTAARAATLDEFQQDIGRWGDETFPQSTPETVLAHFDEEASEFVEAARNYAGQVSTYEEEATDCLLLLLHFAHKNAFSLMDAAVKKMAKNRERVWNTEAEPAGHFKHVDTP